MEKPIIRVHNVQTDEIIDRPMNDNEFVEYQKQQLASLELKAELEAKKTAAEAKLEALGLTAEDLKALGL